MSIDDLKREQEEGLLRLKVYSQALRKLDEKLVLFYNEAARAIFQTVESRTSLSLEHDHSSSSPMTCREIPMLTTPRYELQFNWVSFHVSGTNIHAKIGHGRYICTMAFKQDLLFGISQPVEKSVKFKTDLDACILPFDLELLSEGTGFYSFTWKGMEDNPKVMNAIISWLDKKKFPPPDF